ncbi:hypothetical protein BsWGS_06094 [Bradybaena similaris]
MPRTSGDFVEYLKNPSNWIPRPVQSFPVRHPPQKSKYEKMLSTFNISSSVSVSDYTPNAVLRMMCDQVFPNNAITLFYLNNHLAVYQYDQTNANYLPKIISSLGLPIISYDTQFSIQDRPKLTLQLAPTMGQMMDVVFAFMKNYGWTDFSFLCTLSYGCEDELFFIELKIKEFKRKIKQTVHGIDDYSYNLLSYVNFTDGENVTETREKLKYELHKDSRINFVHGAGKEVKVILDVAATLNLTGKDYVWIFTATSVTMNAKFVSPSYPLGSFIIGFDSSRDSMIKVVKMAVSLWIDALKDLAESPEMDSIDFSTDFSCERMKDEYNNTSRPPLFWKYGEILYRYILKTKLPGGLEFDEFGVLKANKFVIMNVQKQVNTSTGEAEETTTTRHTGQRGVVFRTPGSSSRAFNAPSSRRPSEDDKDAASYLHHNGESKYRTGRNNDTVSPHHRDTASRSSRTRSSPSRGTDSDAWPSGQHSRTMETDDQFSRSSSRDTPYSSYSRSRESRFRFSEGRNGDSEDGSSRAHFSRSKSHPFTSGENVESHRRLPEVRNSDWSFKYDTYDNGSADNMDASRMPNASRGGSFTSGETSFKTRSDPHEPQLNNFGGYDSSDIRQGFHHSGDNPSGRSRSYGHDNFRLRNRRSVLRGRGSRLRHFTQLLNTGKGASYTSSTIIKNEPLLSRAKRDDNQKQIQRRIADWDGQNLTIYGITWPGGESAPPKGKPEKYILKVVTVEEDPHVIFRDMKEGEKPGEKICEPNSVPCTINNRNDELKRTNGTREACCTGLCIDLLIHLGQILKFDVELFEVPDDQSYGAPLNPNNTEWDGMLGNLIKHEADMAIGAVAITPERSVAVDFSVPFLQTGITIIVALRHGEISTTAFLEPYDYPSWSLILLFSVHATGASIFIFEWLSPYGLDQGKTSYSVHKFSLFRSFWLIWAMLFGASVSTDQPRGVASRFLANIWALFAVVFCASYTANLAAFMITKDAYYDLSGIQDWRLKNPHHVKPPFKFATIGNSSTDLNIKKNYIDIYRYMKNYAQTDVKEAIRNLKAGDIQAFIYDSTTLEYEVGKDDGCKLKTVGKRIAETGYGVAFPKRSTWVKDVDGALLQLQENGEIERLQKHWLARACHSKKETGVSSHTLGILNFTSAFVLLGTGVVLGVLILSLEHMYFRFGRKSLRKLDKNGCCSLVSLSMGQSLTFEQSVMEAMDYHKHHRCKDPLCETQLWKVKHDLDIAILKISQLRRQLAYTASVESAKECNYGASFDYDSGDSPYQNGNARRRRQKVNDANQAKTEPFSNQPLLALEGKSDTDDENTPIHSPNHKVVPYASRSSVPVAKRPPGNDSKMKTRYSYQEPGSPRGNNRRPSEERLTKRNSVGQRNHKSFEDDISDLDLRPPPPSFDEVMSRYTTSPADEVMTPSPSPPLPPPPASPPPPAAPSPLQHSPQDLSSSTTSNSIPSSDNKRYEPFILDSPESPSFSSFSETSDNRLLCPGTLSKLSDEVPSTALSQDVESNFNSSPDISKSLDDSSNFPIVGYSESQLSKPSKHPTSSVDNAKPSALPEAHQTHTQMSLLNSLKEADNDVNTRQARDADSNIYVNVDDIGGKETVF